MEKHIVSRKRIADFGEVYTPSWIVNAMLDLVKPETERIESRFLEPACGSGNFLVEILTRKMRVVEKRYRRSQPEYERYAVLAVSSIYGIDILEDNVAECRERLFGIFDNFYTQRFKLGAKEDCRAAVRFILGRNIVWGDALTLQTVGEHPEAIVFSEWSPVNSNLLKRRDFAFHELLLEADEEHFPLFAVRERPLYSDLGKKAFIPSPVKDFPLVHFLRVADADQS